MATKFVPFGSAQLGFDPSTEAPDVSEFTKGARAATLGMGSSLRNAFGATADAFGANDLARGQYQEADRLAQRAQGLGPRIGSLEQLEKEGYSLRNMGDYAAGVIGGVLPSAAVGMVPGMVASTPLRALAGATMAYTPMEMGDTVAKMREANPGQPLTADQTLRAAGTGVVSAAGQSIVPAVVGGKLAGKIASPAGPVSLRQAFGRNAWEVPMEGLTEGGSEAIKQLGANPDAPLDWQQIKENAVAGAIGGTPMAGVGAVGDYVHGRGEQIADAAGKAKGAVTGLASKAKDPAGQVVEDVAVKPLFGDLTQKAGDAYQDFKADVTEKGIWQATSDTLKGFQAQGEDLVSKVANDEFLGDTKAFASATGDKAKSMLDESTAKAMEQAKAWGEALMGRAGVSEERKAKIAAAMSDLGDAANRAAIATAKGAADTADVFKRKFDAFKRGVDNFDKARRRADVDVVATWVDEDFDRQVDKDAANHPPDDAQLRLAHTEAVREADAAGEDILPKEIREKYKNDPAKLKAYEARIRALAKNAGPKKSEDYSGLHQVILEELAPHIPVEVLEDPQGREAIASTVRRFIQLAQREDSPAKLPGGKLDAMDQFAHRQALREVHSSLAHLLGDDAESVLGNLYQAAQLSGDDRADKAFFGNLQATDRTGKTYGSLGQALRDKLPEDSPLRAQDPRELADHLLRWASADKPNTPQNEFHDREVRKQIESIWGANAPAVFGLIEQQALKDRKQPGKSGKTLGDSTEAELDDAGAEHYEQLAAEEDEAQFMRGADGKLRDLFVGKGGDPRHSVLGDMDKPGIDGLLRSVEHQTRDGKFPDSSTRSAMDKLRTQYPGHNVAFVSLRDYQRQTGKSDVELRERFGLGEDEDLGTHGYIKMHGKPVDDEALEPHELRAMRLDTAARANSPDRVEFGAGTSRFIGDAPRITRVMDKKLPYNESDDRSREHRLARAFMEGYGALMNQHGAPTQELSPDLVISREGGKALTAGDIAKLGFRPEVRAREEGLGKNELQARETLGLLSGPELSSYEKRVTSQLDAAREALHAAATNALKGQGLGQTEYKASLAQFKQQHAAAFKVPQLDDLLGSVQYEQDRRVGDTRRARVVNTNGDDNAGIEVNRLSANTAPEGLAKATDDHVAKVIGSAPLLGAQIRALTQRIAAAEKLLEGKDDKLSTGILRKRIGEMTARLDELKAKEAKATRGADMGSGRTEVGKDEQIHTAAVGLGEGASLEHRVNMDGSTIQHKGDAGLTYDHRAALRSLDHQIKALEAQNKGRPGTARDAGTPTPAVSTMADTVATLKARHAELQAQHDTLTPKGEVVFHESFGKRLEAFRETKMGQLGRNTKSMQVQALNSLLAKAQAVAEVAAQSNAGVRDKLMHALDLKGRVSDAALVINALHEATAGLRKKAPAKAQPEGSPDPKAVAAKKAAFLKRAASGDKALVQELASSNDAKGLQRALEAMVEAGTTGPVWDAANRRLGELVGNDDVAYGLQTKRYSLLPVEPEWIYHGTRAAESALIDAAGNLVLKPSKNFGGKVNGVSFTKDKASAVDYATRIKGGGPNGFTFKEAKLLKIHPDALKNLEEEAMGEWADYTGQDVVVPKSMFSVEPVERTRHLFRDSHFENQFREWFRDSYSDMEREEIYATDDWQGEYQERFLEEIVDAPDAYAADDVTEAKAILRDQFGWKKFDKTRTNSANTNTAQQRQAVEAHIHDVLGSTVKTSFARILHAGEFDRTAIGDIIRVSVHSLDPMSVAYHESLHAFFAQMRDKGLSEVQKVVERAASSPVVLAQLRQLLAHSPEALGQLADPEERAAYMYQFWAAGKLKLGEKPATILGKIAAAFRKLMGVWTNDERALHILDYFNTGEYAKTLGGPNSVALPGAGRSAVAQALLGPGRNRAWDAAAGATQQLAQLGDSVWSAGSARLRDSGIGALERLADLIKAEGTAARRDPGFVPAVRLKRTELMNELGRGVAGMSKEEVNEAMEALQQGREATSLGARRAQRVVKDLLAKTRAYMQAAGVDVGDLGSDYFPRQWDSHYISKNQGAFVGMLRSYGLAPEVMNKIIAREGGELGIEVDRPGMQFRKERKLAMISPGDAAPFVVKDLFQTLDSYVTQAVRRAEWAKRFDDDSKGLRDLIDDAVAQGATPEQISMAQNYVKGVNGTLGDGINPTWRRLQGNLIVYQNIRLLPLAIFSSIVDPMGIMVRGGSMGDAFGAFKRGMREIPKGWKNDTSIDLQTELATTLGVIDDAALTHALGSLYGQGMVGGTARKINDTFFRLNLMEQFNQSMRVGATTAAMRFMRRHADGRASQHSARWMDELGLKPGDVKVHGDRIAVDVTEGLSAAQAARVRMAVNRWVDGAVLRPDAADKPIWMNDPHWALVAHLKQFVYSFHHTILKRVWHEAKNGNYTPAMALSSYVPIMIAADMAKGLIVGGGDEPEWKKGWGVTDYVGHGIQRAGLLGVSEFAVDGIQGLRRGDATSLLGPTVEQLSDAVGVVGGRKQFGPVALHALPANALYSGFVGSDAPS